jgi:hypothetical protein
MKRAILLGSLALVLGLGSSSASADTIFSLNTEGCSSGCNVLPAGTITLHQNGANDVTVTVQLDPNYSFRDGNATHWALGFDLANGISGVGASNINGFGQSFSFLGSGTYNDPPLGTFQYAFNCTTCTSGGNAGTTTQKLSFDLIATGLTEASFISNGTYYFGVDVVGLTQAAGVGLTGNIGATGPGTPPPPSVPEPSSLMLFGTGVTALGGLLRRRMTA